VGVGKRLKQEKQSLNVGKPTGRCGRHRPANKLHQRKPLIHLHLNPSPYTPSPSPPPRNSHLTAPSPLPLRPSNSPTLPVTLDACEKFSQHQQSRNGRQTGDPKGAHLHSCTKYSPSSPAPALCPHCLLAWYDHHARNRPFLALHNDGPGHGSSLAISQRYIDLYYK
jgi:hypothetical protein